MCILGCSSYFGGWYLCLGAKNVINACRKSGVKRLVFDSTADIVFNGSQDICNGDESLQIPSKVCAK